MIATPANAYTAKSIQTLDHIAIEEFDCHDLMQRAGKAVFNVLKQNYPSAKKIAIFSGKGNNGGDGLVVAHCAQKAGFQVTLYHTHPVDAWQGEAHDALVTCQNLGITLTPFTEDTILAQGIDILIDALLGTGIRGEVSDLYAKIINKINAHPSPTIAVDIPSGLNADTGAILGSAIEADLTVTFIGLKQGLLTGDGPNVVGDILFENLSVPKEVYAKVPPNACISSFKALRHHLPKRTQTTHKGVAGHVLVIAGDKGFGGAGLMAATSAYRTGAGLVTLATHKAHASEVMAAQPEIMVKGIDNAGQLDKLIEKVDAMVIGPGLTATKWSTELIAKSLPNELPKVIDAGALDYLKSYNLKPKNAILTPHPGEAARLLSISIAQIQQDRFSAMTSIASDFDSTIILKGAGSLVYQKDLLPLICTAGNPGMATGGMGDILAGVIGAFLGEGVNPFDAACLGVQLHSEAADLAAQHLGQRSLIASDLIPFIFKMLKGV